MSGQTLWHKRKDVLCEDTERSILGPVWETRPHVGDVCERKRGIAEAEVLFTRSDSLVVELRSERHRVRALHARARLRLVTKRARQIELVADSRTKALRVVDTLRTTIVALPVVREDRRDGVEWTSTDSIVTCCEE